MGSDSDSLKKICPRHPYVVLAVGSGRNWRDGLELTRLNGRSFAAAIQVALGNALICRGEVVSLTTTCIHGDSI